MPNVARPAALRSFDGNRRADKRNDREPRPEIGVPSPPTHLQGRGLAEWHRLAPELTKIGLLTHADANAFAGYCLAHARHVEAELALQEFQKTNPQWGGLMVVRGSSMVVNPLVTLARAAMADVLKQSIELGLTPSARVKLTVDPHRNNPTTAFIA